MSQITTHLSREHVDKVMKLLRFLEIPAEQMMRTFRGTLESEVWHNDPVNWTAGHVYPDKKTAARIAKGVHKRFPHVLHFLDMTFLKTASE